MILLKSGLKFLTPFAYLPESVLDDEKNLTAEFLKYFPISLIRLSKCRETKIWHKLH